MSRSCVCALISNPMEDILVAEPYGAPRIVVSDDNGVSNKTTATGKGGGTKPKRAPSAYNMFQKVQMAQLGATMSGRDKFSRVAGMWSELPDIEKQRMKDFLKTNMQILSEKVPDPKKRFELVTELWIEMQ